ncbi:putative 2'-deoxynucleoside 5'-phosphate N-hydrolase 1 [Littorina saxatilis]|uniref:Putative 2'-deoxynucleoside 5'-phosphate N-hydrolase 1 n=1 Tax=Littorina saxatilis TaxID=31220 RepID=A0AAN9BLB9_9CAEN
MSHNIYFARSICGGCNDSELYSRIIQQLKQYGHVFTEHVADPQREKDVKMDDKGIHDGDMEWLHKSDAVVAECTTPSLGVGYEIGRAVALNKKILCLFRPESGKRLSAMIRGAEADGSSLTCKDYKEEELPEILKTFFASL